MASALAARRLLSVWGHMEAKQEKEHAHTCGRQEAYPPSTVNGEATINGEKEGRYMSQHKKLQTTWNSDVMARCIEARPLLLGKILNLAAGGYQQISLKCAYRSASIGMAKPTFAKHKEVQRGYLSMGVSHVQPFWMKLDGQSAAIELSSAWQIWFELTVVHCFSGRCSTHCQKFCDRSL